MSRRLAHLFADCLQAIGRGEMTAADCLERHPKQRDELAALFAMRAAIEAVTIEPCPEFRRTARSRLLQRLPDIATRNPVPVGKRWSWFRGPAPVALRLASAASMAALLLILTLTAVAGAWALPGDPLYPLKIAAEEARLAAANGAEAVALRLKHTRTRVVEIEAMANQQRPADVALAVLVLEERVSESTHALITMAREDAVRLQDLRTADHVLYETGEELQNLLPYFSGASRSWVERALDVTTGQRDRLVETFPNTIQISSQLSPDAR
jgi:hypothetical protein